MKNITSAFLSPIRENLDQLGDWLSTTFGNAPSFKVVYFYHIPKCGGTYTLRLLQKFQRTLNSDFKSFNILSKQRTNPEAEEEQLAFLHSLKNYNDNKVLLIHQHNGFPGINDLHEHLATVKKEVKENGGEIVFITMIREPISHITSMVNYARMNKRNGITITFDSIPVYGIVYNKMSKFLLHGQPKRWKNKKVPIDKELLHKNIRLFDYIFTLERLDLLTSFLNNFLGTKNVILPEKINASIIDLLPTEEQKKHFLSHLNWDTYFYDLVSSKGPNVKHILPSNNETLSSVLS